MERTALQSSPEHSELAPEAAVVHLVSDLDYDTADKVCVFLNREMDLASDRFRDRLLQVQHFTISDSEGQARRCFDDSLLFEAQ